MAKSKWPSVKEKLHLVERWARDGLTEKQIGKNLGISHQTMEEYKKNYNEFSVAIKKGKEVLIYELENALIKKAFGYEYEESRKYIKDEDGVKTTYTEVTKKHQPPDTAAAFILLKNKAPEKYADNPQMLELKKQELELKKLNIDKEQW